MSLVYVTGISGSGKTTVRAELRKRGYEAYGTDEDHIAAFFDNKTGKFVGYPNNLSGSAEWRSKHTWKIQRNKLEELVEANKNGVTFVCGTVANEAEVWDLFDKVIALVINEDTLRHRLATRTGNNYGQDPSELAMILEWNKNSEANYRSYGATIVDASGPIDNVVDEVILLSYPS